ncbi:MAG: cell division protein ZapE [Pseudomonadota bacterium]
MTEGLMPIYRARVADGTLKPDPDQARAAEKLQILHNRLTDYRPEQPKTITHALFGWGREKVERRPLPGVYLYGGVGRGKSMLMDLFFDASCVARKRRVHFHAFMQETHAAIHAARAGGAQDPIPPVADAVADAATLLCFDEMQITDITDAMLVGRLFERLFARGVVVVATSNRHPDDLYKDGLNRHLFQPFIALIKDRLDVHELDAGTDHRQARLAEVGVYHTPLGGPASAALEASWAARAGGAGAPLPLHRGGRRFVIPRYLNGVARAGFADLCEAPLGPGDYLALAQAARVVILEDIPVMGPAQANAAKRFVTLIDALYEARVRLICSAAAEPEALYVDGTGAFEFARTASRLAEMRSTDWARQAAA